MRVPRLAVALALCAGAVGPVSITSVACAGEGGSAALVIDTGAAVTIYCVALPEPSVSGLELVELAGEQHGLDYSLGFGGEAVCRLEGVGPEGDDCFGEYPEFWGYWHGNGSGGWTWAGTGAGSASIEDGDVDGWSWGTGDNGSNHQAPPATQHEDVCVVAEKARPDPGKQRPGSSATPAPPPAETAARTTGDAGEAAPGSAPAAESSDEQRSRGRARPPEPARAGRPTVAPVAPPSPEPTTVAAEPAGDTGESGPPVTGLVGLAAAAGLGVAAWRGSRRRAKS